MAKWMAIEAGADTNVIIIAMLALGSALTVVYWARWGGSLMATRKESATTEKQALLIRLPLTLLCVGAVGLSFAAPWIYNSMLAPWVGTAPFTMSFGSLDSTTGSFAVVPLFIVLGLGLLFAIKMAFGPGKAKLTPPYLGGANSNEDGTYIGPMNGNVPFSAGNLYLGELFAEGKLTPVFNLLAIGLIVLMLGGAL
jgi:ech hydrogenase subunit A